MTAGAGRRRCVPWTRESAADREALWRECERLSAGADSLAVVSATTAPEFDLQSHSVHSDGALEPAGVVAAAAAAGVELLALSDHDTAAGVPAAQEAATAAGIGLVTAAEITALFEGRQDLHILGYRIDPHESRLVQALHHSQTDRERRAERMSDALRELGFALDDEMLARRAAQGQSIGRPHLAQAVVAQPENRAAPAGGRAAGSDRLPGRLSDRGQARLP